VFGAEVLRPDRLIGGLVVGRLIVLRRELGRLRAGRRCGNGWRRLIGALIIRSGTGLRTLIAGRGGRVMTWVIQRGRRLRARIAHARSGVRARLGGSVLGRIVGGVSGLWWRRSLGADIGSAGY